MHSVQSTGYGIKPFNVVYEDFIQDYEGTVIRVLDFLGIQADNVKIHPPAFDKLADDTTKQWVQMCRQESQKGWDNVR
ncbi:LPS sulfotransferase NodH [Paenibacillus rhizosphaerae]|uniref:LPS sulfotransferase NodH n=1 Tax=Paenibacillus rhizosphaerae TaxID=297318 RepID=A0A839U0A0_9BACL|nr:Stf0 family sulfotransferase [Paenibacillus rhizosphaerae]MBB3132262.1 LPS sulfotransferase NodH [Paenibacillus rhizosphaerae]